MADGWHGLRRARRGRLRQGHAVRLNHATCGSTERRGGFEPPRDVAAPAGFQDSMDLLQPWRSRDRLRPARDRPTSTGRPCWARSSRWASWCLLAWLIRGQVGDGHGRGLGHGHGEPALTPGRQQVLGELIVGRPSQRWVLVSPPGQSPGAPLRPRPLAGALVQGPSSEGGRSIPSSTEEIAASNRAIRIAADNSVQDIPCVLRAVCMG